MLKSKIILKSFIALLVIVFASNAIRGQASQPVPPPPPIDQARDISLNSGQSTIYILNRDDTISAYDSVENKFIFSRTRLSGISNIRQILINNNDSKIAFVHFSDGNFKVSIVNLLKGSNEKLEAASAVSYILGGQLTQGGLKIKFSEDGKKLFATYGEKDFYIFSTEKQEQKKITVGELPSNIETDNLGMVLVINDKSESLSIIDPIKKTVRATVKLGSSPKEIIFNRVTDRAYISNTVSDDVYVVDTSSAKVTRIIKVGADPASLTYDEASGAVFVANNSSGTISIISPNFSVENVDLGSAAYFQGSPIRIAFMNDGKKLFIVNASEAKYFVYDINQSRVIKEGKTENFPTKILVSEKSKSAFILYWDANSLLVIDSRTLTENYIPDSAIATEVFFSKPQSVVADTATNRIFVSNLGSDYVTVIDGNTQKPIKKIVVGNSIQNLFLNRKTRKLYAVSPPDNTFAVIDISKSGYPMKTVKLEQQPRGGAINEITNKIYYSNSAKSKVSIIDGYEDKVIATVDLPEKSFPLVNSIDEKRDKIYTALYGGNSIVVIDGKSNKIERFITVGANPIWVRYLPEIDRIFVSVEGERKVLVVDPGSNNILQTIQISGKPYRIFFDSTTNFVYINRRDEDIVTVLKLVESSNQFEVVENRSMQYWGETDTRYNMLIYNERTQLVYITEGVANRVRVVKPEHDDKGVLKGIWYATINADGSVIYSSLASGDLAQKNKRVLYVVIGAIIILLFIIAAIVIFRRKKTEI